MRRLGMVISLALLVLLGLTVTTASAQTGVVWNAQFYNNTYLGGNPAFQAQYSSIAFNWGVGAPAPGVSVDDFSARFATGAIFEAGTYRFYLRADDAARLSVDFEERINTLNAPRPDELITSDVTFTERGEYNVQVDFREGRGTASLYLSWQSLTPGQSPVVPSFPQQPSFTGVNTAAWTAQYYGNPSLNGYPTLIQVDGTPSHDWGSGSPVSSIPSDGFSARWTTLQTLPAGSYQLSVRADDGVRVYVNGVAYIDQWHDASGQTYTANLTLPAGQHNFIVEYYENNGAAFLDYNLARLTVTNPVPTAAPIIFPTVVFPSQTVNLPNFTGTTATVTAFRLNVRNSPNPFDTNVVTRINRSETYPVVGRNADGSWWQLNVNGQLGWVNGQFVTISNLTALPVTSQLSFTDTVATNTGFSLTANTNVNIRSASSTSSAVLGRFPSGARAQIIGRNTFNTWWLIEYAGITGWVSGNFVTLQANADLSQIPAR